MLRHTVTALIALSTVFTAACTQETDETNFEYAEVIEYVDGAKARTSNGAFEVTLFSEEGEAQSGANVFYLRVAMPDPADEGGEGWGVPEADIGADVECDEATVSAVDQRVTYEGDGTYRVDAVELGSGTCELSFDIAVGETIRENVSFFFSVE